MHKNKKKQIIARIIVVILILAMIIPLGWAAVATVM